jgi:Tfp pilus assembly protein PilF
MDRSVAGFFESQFNKEYRKILSLPHSPTDERIFCHFGQLSIQIKRWKEAKAAFTKALTLRPDSLEANLGLIRLFYEQRKYKEMFGRIQRIRKDIALDEEDNPRLREFMRCWFTLDMDMDKDPR